MTSPTLAAVVAAAGLMLVAVRIYSADQPVSDDAFITYRYAENLAGGHGFVFNRGAAPVQGTTTPLYTALLALGARLGADIPALSLVLGATALAAAAGLVVLLARDLGALAAGVAAALTWSASPLTWYSVAGMETPLYMALTLGTIWAAYHGRAGLAFLVGALAVLTRLDGLAVLAAAGALLVLSRRWSWPGALGAAALLAGWAVLANAMFGSPIPSSGLAKLVHEDGISGRFNPLSPTLLELAFPASRPVLEEAEAPYLAPVVLGAGGCLLAAASAASLLSRRARAGGLLVLWLTLYVTGFGLLQLPHFSWYYTPMALAAGLLLWVVLQGTLSAVVRALARALGWDARRAAGVIAPLVLILGAGLAVATAGYSRTHGPPQDLPAQQEAGEWLRHHAGSEDTVAAYEIGKVAFYSGRAVVDMLGLTEPRAREAVRAQDYAWAVREGPAYVFANEHVGWVVTDRLFRSCEFALHYQPAARFPFRQGLDYVLYRRAAGQAPGDGGVESGGSGATGEPGGSAGSDEAGGAAPGRERGGAGWATWVNADVPRATPPGTFGAYSVVLQNLSPSAWEPAGPQAVYLSYHWLRPDGTPAVWDGERTPLPCTVQPGQRVLVSARVKAPSTPGEYRFQWDAVHATYGWLSGPPSPPG